MTRIGSIASVVIAIALALVGTAWASGSDDEPDVSTSAATSVTSSSAVLNGLVNPNDEQTDYLFEYGPTAAYGAQTSSSSAGGSDSWKSVSKAITGLQPGTTYHFRIVAENDEGTDRGSDRSFTTAGAPPPDPDPGPGDPPPPGDDPGPGVGEPGSVSPPDTEEKADSPDQPKLGSSVVVAPGEGTLLVRRPGRNSFVPLEFGSKLPLGTEVDARAGTLALTSALPSGKTQTGRFGGGRFVIRQGKRGYVDLFLRGRTCLRPAGHTTNATVAVAARRPRSGRRLWGRDNGGRFRTHGKNSHATVRGTRWMVEDRCDGTLTRVTGGAVVVRDTVRHKRVVLKAGQRYLARPRR